MPPSLPIYPPDPGPPRFHLSRNTAVTLTPGTVTIRLANVSEAEWQWLHKLLVGRGWKSY
jgi:hypothetical protein